MLKIMHDFDNVDVMVSFTYRHEIILVPHVNKYLVCDQSLCNCENIINNMHNPLDPILKHLDKIIPY